MADDDKFDKLTEFSVSKLVPGSALVQDLCGVVFGSNDEAFKQAVFEDVQDHVLKLQESIRRLQAQLADLEQRFDESLGAIRERKILKDFLNDLSDAQGEAKRRAITNATARQYDPRLGAIAARRYWLDLVRGLDDHEIHIVSMIRNGGGIVLMRKEWVWFSESDWKHLQDQVAGQWIKAEPEYHELSGEHEWTALEAALKALFQNGLASQQSARIHNPDWKGQAWFLTPKGKQLWAVIGDLSAGGTIESSPKTD